jgi:hypothetical protein
VITEGICLDVVRELHGMEWGMTRTLRLDDSPTATPDVQRETVSHAMPPGHLIRLLLPRYSLSDVEAAVRWLEIGEYLSSSGYGFAPRLLIHLTTTGVALAQRGRLEDGERNLVYQEDPYAAFVARQFAPKDDPLFEYLRDTVLGPLGIAAVDGRVDGIEAFRGDILRKIRASRFFVCILTHRKQLQDGAWASSVWLYQETGAAVALGKRPLILVENGMDDHFAGELQKNYEYIPFQRETFREAFGEVSRRIQNDLNEHFIPLRL